MAILWNHCRRIPPIPFIRERDIAGYVGVDRRLLGYDLPLIEEVGMAEVSSRADLLADEQNTDVLTDLDARRGTENIRPCGSAWKYSVEFPTPSKTTTGGLLNYRILWRPIGKVS